ncbi:bacterial proteasome activator family protein [Saxibacter everestensis]|uniref:Bacterial proteasome activator n=1 Tax=Saxibacter everestensis TaxID=2909229 RepID=A0ABY8QQJ2_9MICO|nr:bacterial proteasome activator family protein [Brevibacteriaceae bacterium ZFBP1038]
MSDAQFDRTILNTEEGPEAEIARPDSNGAANAGHRTSADSPAAVRTAASGADGSQDDEPLSGETLEVQADGEPEEGESGERSPVEDISQPAKVMRIGSMIKQLLDEVRNAPLDDAGRARLAEVHERSLKELEEGLSPELVGELHRITLPFADGDAPPSDAELRIAQAQLVGWLEGLFHGIQTALVAQQMAAQAQLAQMRHALPPGTDPRQAAAAQAAAQGMPGPRQDASDPHSHGTGQYL